MTFFGDNGLSTVATVATGVASILALAFVLALVLAFVLPFVVVPRWLSFLCSSIDADAAATAVGDAVDADVDIVVKNADEASINSGVNDDE